MTFLARLTLFASVGLLLTACASSNPARGTLTPTASATPPTCEPSQILTSANSFPEIQGTLTPEGEVWALLFFDQAHAKQDAKIVWRVTGTGAFSVQAQHEDGTVIHPIWGPEYHGGSTWQRPGDEWGTGFNFPKPGCWTLMVTRGAATGEIYLEVTS